MPYKLLNGSILTFQGDECVTCAGVGAILDENLAGVCSTTVTDSKAELIFGRFVCKIGYYELDNDCHKCIGPGAVWENNACKCTDRFSAEFEETPTDGICTCGANNLFESNAESRCIACNGVGEFDTVNGICECNDNAGTENNFSLCRCLDNY